MKLQSNELEDIKTNINLINKALNNLPRTSVYRNNLEKILNQ
nr:MAG TPA: ETC complex I subunit conserved region [Caudoviricetes sp.]